MSIVVCKLAELEPELIKIVDANMWRHDVGWDEADGLWFVCPKCWLENGRSATGAHHVLCWQPHVGQEHAPRPGRWKMQGTSLADVTLVAGSSSVKIGNAGDGGCQAHFFIRGGRVEDLEGFKG